MYTYSPTEGVCMIAVEITRSVTHRLSSEAKKTALLRLLAHSRFTFVCQAICEAQGTNGKWHGLEN